MIYSEPKDVGEDVTASHDQTEADLEAGSSCCRTRRARPSWCCASGNRGKHIILPNLIKSLVDNSSLLLQIQGTSKLQKLQATTPAKSEQAIGISPVRACKGETTINLDS